MNKIAWRITGLSVAIIGFGLGIWSNDVTIESNTIANTVTPVIPIEIYPPEGIIAKSVLVYDLDSKKTIYEKDASDVRPLASLTKLMTIYAGSRLFGVNDILTPEGQSFEDLSDMALIASSNDAAEKIAIAGGEKIGVTGDIAKDALFIDYMNMVSNDLKLDAHFSNSTGLDMNGSSGANGSAYDVVKLASALLDSIPNVFERSSFTSVIWQDGSATNTNKLIYSKPFIFSSKTGLTDIAGGNLLTIIVLPINKPVAIVVLGSTEEGRFGDVEKLVDFVLKKYANM